MNAAYDYDLAFSFLKEDEPLAVSLADTLADRYKSFVYTKKQEELAGADGQEVFSTVFDTCARCAVVLYRNGWGTTPWTRIEQTAIQNRGLRDGWDFMLFIKLDRVATMPKWLPHSHIWHDFERYGPVGAAGAIGSLIQRSGGTPRVETLDQKAERIRREIEFEQRRKDFKRSEGGVKSARAGVTKVIAALEERAGRLSLVFKRSRQPYEVCVLGKIVGSMARWTGHYANSLDDSYLEVSYWQGHPPLFGSIYLLEEPRRIEGERFEFDLTTTGEHVWRATSGRQQRAYSADALADEIIGVFLEKEREAHKH